MGEAVKYDAVPGKYTEVFVEAEVLSEGASDAADVIPKNVNATEDTDAEASAHP